MSGKYEMEQFCFRTSQTYMNEVVSVGIVGVAVGVVVGVVVDVSVGFVVGVARVGAVGVIVRGVGGVGTGAVGVYVDAAFLLVGVALIVLKFMFVLV